MRPLNGLILLVLLCDHAMVTMVTMVTMVSVQIAERIFHVCTGTLFTVNGVGSRTVSCNLIIFFHFLFARRTAVIHYP